MGRIWADILVRILTSWLKFIWKENCPEYVVYKIMSYSYLKISTRLFLGWRVGMVVGGWGVWTSVPPSSSHFWSGPSLYWKILFKVPKHFPKSPNSCNLRSLTSGPLFSWLHYRCIPAPPHPPCRHEDNQWSMTSMYWIDIYSIIRPEMHPTTPVPSAHSLESN